jgi:hypothetical protein
MQHRRRRSILPFVGALVLGGVALISGRADALPLGLTEGAHKAFDTANPVEKAACWRFGWRGWGWYRFCGPPLPVPLLPPPPPAVVYDEDVYVPGCREVTERVRRGREVVVRHIRRCV